MAAWCYHRADEGARNHIHILNDDASSFKQHYVEIGVAHVCMMDGYDEPHTYGGEVTAAPTTVFQRHQFAFRRVRKCAQSCAHLCVKGVELSDLAIIFVK